jgi:hypothetical protein
VDILFFLEDSFAFTAIEAFCHTFEAKTNNNWEEICSGVPFSRSYHFSHE